MTNDNYNTNTLVSTDDDPTVELEVSGLRKRVDAEAQQEVDANTFDTADDVLNNTSAPESMSALATDLSASKKTVSRLQFDIAQLRTRMSGLESEIEARQGQTLQLNNDLAMQLDALDRKDKLLKKRDRNVKLLKTEIREREKSHQDLQTQFSDLKQSKSRIELTPPPPPPSTDASSRADRDHSTDNIDLMLNQSTAYADNLRRQLQQRIEASGDAEVERDYLTRSLQRVTARNVELAKTVQKSEEQILCLEEQLSHADKQHQQEIKTVRFELGDAQNTMAESASLNSQLTSDLIAARGQKDDIQLAFGNAKKCAKSEISALEKELTQLVQKTDSLQQKLLTKSEAIALLMEEIANRSSQEKPPDERIEVVHELDDTHSGMREGIDRITRVLVARVDGQTLRFPLFKNKLTIGRTEDNDIQMKAAHVSRHHAVLKTDGDLTRVIDWGSKNGVFVNAEKVSEHFLNHGDIITIGNAKFRYEEVKRRDG